MKGLTKLSLSPGLEPRQGRATLRNGSEHPDSSDFTPHTSAGLKPPPPRFHSQQKCSPSLQGRQTKGRGSGSSPSEDDPLGVCGSSRGKIGEWAPAPRGAARAERDGTGRTALPGGEYLPGRDRTRQGFPRGPGRVWLIHPGHSRCRLPGREHSRIAELP